MRARWPPRRECGRGALQAATRISPSHVNGAVTCKVVEGWKQLPKSFAHRDVAGFSVNRENRVFRIC